jgi:hypothetical protein
MHLFAQSTPAVIFSSAPWFNRLTSPSIDLPVTNRLYLLSIGDIETIVRDEVREVADLDVRLRRPASASAIDVIDLKYVVAADVSKAGDRALLKNQSPELTACNRGDSARLCLQ